MQCHERAHRFAAAALSALTLPAVYEGISGPSPAADLPAAVSPWPNGAPALPDPGPDITRMRKALVCTQRLLSSSVVHDFQDLAREMAQAERVRQGERIAFFRDDPLQLLAVTMNALERLEQGAAAGRIGPEQLRMVLAVREQLMEPGAPLKMDLFLSALVDVALAPDASQHLRILHRHALEVRAPLRGDRWIALIELLRGGLHPGLMISQGRYPHCGRAAIEFAYTHDDPVGKLELGLQLLLHGSAVTPAGDVLTVDPERDFAGLTPASGTAGAEQGGLTGRAGSSSAFQKALDHAFAVDENGGLSIRQQGRILESLTGEAWVVLTDAAHLQRVLAASNRTAVVAVQDWYPKEDESSRHGIAVCGAPSADGHLAVFDPNHPSPRSFPDGVAREANELLSSGLLEVRQEYFQAHLICALVPESAVPDSVPSSAREDWRTFAGPSHRALAPWWAGLAFAAFLVPAAIDAARALYRRFKKH